MLASAFEKIVTFLLAGGIMAYLIGIRFYSIYASLRESQRPDKVERTDVQTLFSTPEDEPRGEASPLQTLFAKDDEV